MGEVVPELTAELVADGAMPLDPVISPDGRWVAYVVTTMGVKERRVSALWVVAADASSSARRLTPGTAWVGAPRWTPDSDALLFASGGQLYRIGAHGGDAEELASWRGGICGLLPLAGGRRVAVIATGKPGEEDEPGDEDEREKAGRGDALVWGEHLPGSRLWLLDLESRDAGLVGGLGDRHVVEVVQRPGGGPLAVISWDCPQDEPGAFTARLHVVDPRTGTAQDLGRVGLGARSPAWWSADDGWHVACLALTPPGPVGGLAVLDLPVPAAGAAGQRSNLTEGMSACPAELVQVAGGAPLALFADGLGTTLYRLDPGRRRFHRVTGWQGGVDSLTVSNSGEVISARMSTALRPKDVHAGPVAGPLVRLSDTWPQLRGVRWGTQERLSYQARDGLALDALLILPAGRSRRDGPFPLITLVHGGPDDRYADEFQLGWWPSGQWLATAGYAVFLPNPRGCTGHGHEFAAMVAGAVGTHEWTDILAGIDLLIADGVADPGRLGIGGWSHGGFMAAWAVGQTGRFKAALMGAGISDRGMQVGVGELGTLEAGLGGSSGWEGPGPHRHDELSPISYASKIRTPVLMLHGQDDTNVPVGQAMYLHRALSHFGVEHELVVYPREGHLITERDHQIDVLSRTRAWFDRWLADPAS